MTAGAAYSHVVVIGGGITGLAAAWEATLCGARVTVLEASGRCGGKLCTEVVDGLVVEHGPDAFVSYRPAALALIREVGLGDEVVEVRPGRSVSLRVGGRFHPLPEGMGMVVPTRLGPFVRTPILTWPQKLRAALDLVLPRRLGALDVTIGSFLRARLGDGVVERFADPMVGGIYGASVDELSLDAVLPVLRDHERSHRSLLLASWAQGRARRTARGPQSPFRSLRQGLGSLPDRLVEALTESGVTIEVDAAALAVTLDADGTTSVALAGGRTLTADAVIFAAGAHPSAAALADHCPEAAAALREIRHASTTVVTLAWDLTAFAAMPTTQGWLDAGPAPVTGVTVTSTKWPGRAPRDRVLVRAFVPDKIGPLASQPDGVLLDEVIRYAAAHLGATAPPVFTRMTRWTGVMPKYGVGHLDRVRAVEDGLAAYPSWEVAGAALRGVGIPDCIADGRRAARQVCDRLGIAATQALPEPAHHHQTARNGTEQHDPASPPQGAHAS